MTPNVESERTTALVSWIAFSDQQCLAFGPPREVAAAVKALVDAAPDTAVLVFDAASSIPVELDLRGSPAEVLARLDPAGFADDQSVDRAPSSDNGHAQAPARSPGRPKLGVTAREVTLLPRHWEWLGKQPGGASVALRKLVEQAIRANAEADRMRERQESAYRFMTAVAGNAPGHEEAVRALFANDGDRLARIISVWPADVSAHVLRLLGRA